MKIFMTAFMSALFFTTVAAVSNATEASILTCCASIAELLPGQVVYPQAGCLYSEPNNDRWSATAVLRPSCIVQPNCADDVSIAIKVLTKGANEDGSTCKFAVKSGGHTPWAGANDIDGGISIDLDYINSTILSGDSQYISLGTGSTWLNVYNSLNGTGLATAGARCALAGVGGVTLGGGISFFAPRVGFTSDNVISYEVVIASGEIIYANSTSHSDLFKALKGGSGNFGIVTRFDVSTFENGNGELWGGVIVNPATSETSTQLLTATHDLIGNYNDSNAAIGSVFTHNTTTGARIFAQSLVYTNDTQHPEAFRQFESITPQLDNTMRSTTLSDLTAEGDNLLSSVHNVTNDVFKLVENVTDMSWIFSYEPLPTLFTKHSAERGGNVLGLNRTQDNLVLMMLAPRWTSANDDAAMNNAAVNWVTEIQQLTVFLGTDNSFLYLNYADGWQHPLGSYGKANVQFMKQVAEKYDPNGVFQKLVPGGFKISEAVGLGA